MCVQVNVGGQECDQCRPGYFNLDRNDPEGCTECFCFGVTTLCRSANWGLTQVTNRPWVWLKKHHILSCLVECLFVRLTALKIE